MLAHLNMSKFIEITFKAMIKIIKVCKWNACIVKFCSEGWLILHLIRNINNVGRNVNSIFSMFDLNIRINVANWSLAEEVISISLHWTYELALCFMHYPLPLLFTASSCTPRMGSCGRFIVGCIFVYIWIGSQCALNALCAGGKACQPVGL